MTVSVLDCTGCGSCVNVCLAKETAIAMRPLESQVKEAENWTYAVETVEDIEKLCEALKGEQA